MRVLAIDLGPSWRGGQRQTFLVGRELARRGHAVAIAARTGSPLARHTETSEVPLLTCLPLPGGGEASPALLLAAARAAGTFAPDVIWTGDSRGHGVAVWSRIARSRPLAVHRRVIFPPGRHPLSRIKYALADLFLAVSAAARDALVAGGVQPGRVVVVPDGLPEEAFVPRTAPEPPPFRLLHVGAFDGMKGQRLAVEVLARLVAEGWPLRLDLLGEGPERPAVEAFARSRGVSGLCTFAGHVADVPQRLARAHLLLVPSESEAGGLVLLEAMAAGCPIVGHDVGGVREVVANGAAARLLPGLDPGPFTAAVRDLVRSSADREQLSAAGRAAASRLTVAATAEALEGELARLLAP